MNQFSEETAFQHKPDFIFEVSWEVCNKIGGIYTVISTKLQALAASAERGEQLILIGPDVWKETTEHPDFLEDPHLMKSWREHAADQGLYFRVGRWKIAGQPLVILVDFTAFFPKKDEIFAHFWEKYGLDSISGQWDYVEPAMFGYAAGRVIESFYRSNLSGRDKVLAQFHEWMTGTGVLYLKDKTPGIATAFTTHATVLGRSLAGNGRPLYSTMQQVNPDLLAGEFQVKSKYSLEKLAARHCDLFTTVSGITAEECKFLIGKVPDTITPNAFDPTFVPHGDARKVARNIARKKTLEVMSGLFGTNFGDDTMMVLNSGRYEFRNKGIDLFIDAVAHLDKSERPGRKMIAVIAVPAYHHGPRADLLQKLKDGNDQNLFEAHNALTHLLHDPENDPVLKRISHNHLDNKPDGNVFICFIPTYLNGHDGIFDLDYYSFLAGFDLTVFPSYYEPWGYTPLESVAFGIPTVTTSLAGFGLWVMETIQTRSHGAMVIPRADFDDESVTSAMVDHFKTFLQLSEADYHIASQEAVSIAAKANWTSFVQHYLEGYGKAIELASARAATDPYLLTNGRKHIIKPGKELPNWSKVMVNAAYPPELEKLRRLAGNLWWSWNPEAVKLFMDINPEIWLESGNNPICLLSLLKFDELKKLASDQSFIEKMNSVYASFENYMNQQPEEGLPHVAYFSMEFGLHESLKIYSGGLGILAGDYLKEASDDNKRVFGVGLLYRYGYFAQRITPFGDQVAGYIPQKFSDLPILPLRDQQGDWVTISIAFPGRNVYAKTWIVQIGRTNLYLLDTDLEVNAPHDRFITHQLYGGDLENRFKQEMILGVGGIRLIEQLGINPDLYHCNEGHAAFMNFERLRDLVQREYLTYEDALEVVRSSTLFTTHTPVPAGHDRFPEDLLRAYISHYPERLHITWDELVSLGRENPEHHDSLFSMSVLAIRTSQEVNGVSRIHGDVSRRMFNELYDGYFADELHISHVTNGVHYPSWTHPEWQRIHGTFLSKPDFANQHDPEAWKGIDAVPDQLIWSTRETLKQEMTTFLRQRLEKEMTQRQEHPRHIVRVLESLDDPVLTIGFARRFATYKRAHLLFTNEERLINIMGNRKRPVRFIFAGKAHPNDKAGQDLIKKIIEMSRKPAFEGKIIFVENYDMELGRYLTQGCDVWMNTPTRPQEASGTSGEKAIMNGVLNLSVLDGWWAEGYVRGGGWALPEERVYEDQAMQDQLDAETIYNLIDEKIAPLWYKRDQDGTPIGWIEYIRKNFREITPRFTMKRMLRDYHHQFYHKLAERNALMRNGNFSQARILSSWKRRVMVHWDNISVEEKILPDSTVSPLNLGEQFNAKITLHAPGLEADDLGMEVVFGRKVNDVVDRILFKEPLKPTAIGHGKVAFECSLTVNQTGVFDYAFRLYPNHPLLPYRMDFPLVKWI
jgi:glycogen phosphorylase/synthase